MPYPSDHKQKTRQRIVEAARVMFNRRGYDQVSIDEIMAEAQLTRGGFYAHFRSKEELFAEATISFLGGRGAEWRREAGINPAVREALNARRMVDAYLSREHLEDNDGQCPLIAYATDVARAGPQVRQSYQRLAEAMTGLFEMNLDGEEDERRRRALSMTALCVGGMILSRALKDTHIGEDIRAAAHQAATDIWQDGAAVAAE
jgi:AcrR family transcriptional regulator